MRSILAVALLLTAFGTATAQTSAGAPSGSTGECKDGTFSNAPSKRGACAGHKGVKTWFATEAEPKSTAAASATPTAAATPAPSTPAARASTTPAVAAAGGGNGQVWVNTRSKVYHCEGDHYYGKTKAGSYMTEQAAIAAGNRADHGKACKAG